MVGVKEEVQEEEEEEEGPRPGGCGGALEAGAARVPVEEAPAACGGWKVALEAGAARVSAALDSAIGKKIIKRPL